MYPRKQPVTAVAKNDLTNKQEIVIPVEITNGKSTMASIEHHDQINDGQNNNNNNDQWSDMEDDNIYLEDPPITSKASKRPNYSVAEILEMIGEDPIEEETKKKKKKKRKGKNKDTASRDTSERSKKEDFGSKNNDNNTSSISQNSKNPSLNNEIGASAANSKSTNHDDSNNFNNNKNNNTTVPSTINSSSSTTPGKIISRAIMSVKNSTKAQTILETQRNIEKISAVSKTREKKEKESLNTWRSMEDAIKVFEPNYEGDVSDDDVEQFKRFCFQVKGIQQSACV